jgi:AraC-like DNA-binding protein
LHVPDVEQVNAWRPAVPGIAEVLHARFVEHVYPPHTHDTWTVLLIDEGSVRFDLDRHEHGAVRDRITLLPPHVSHTGRAGTPGGFRKRVLYLDTTVLTEELTPAVANEPALVDPLLRRRISELHRVLAVPGESLHAESRLALIGNRLHQHLVPSHTSAAARTGLADALRDLLDSRVADGVSLREAGDLLDAHPDHLVRSFTAAFGLPPHRYLTSRRIDLARRRLLAGEPPADVATAVGFHDQSHLTRHFTKQVGISPARYARGPQFRSR